MRYLFTVAVFFTGCGAIALAGTQEDFEQAVSQTGAEFVLARDKLLQQDADVDLIKGKLDSGNPLEKLTAIMIMGWRSHKELYGKLLTEGVSIDRKGEKIYVWSYDPAQVKPELMPLMYEFLLKDTGDQGGQDAAVRITSFLARRGTKPDVPALFDVIQIEGKLSDESRVAVASTLAALPADLVSVTDLTKLIQKEASRATGDKGVVGSLMNGLIRLGGTLPEDQKDQLVIRLLDMDGLKALMGDTVVLQTVGAIGGQRATTEVSNFLERSEDPLMNRWALSTLGTIGSEDAAKVLFKYAKDEEATLTTRITAIESLARCKYTDEVGDTLEAIVLAGTSGLRERTKALETLDDLHRVNSTKPNTAKAVRSRIEKIAGADVAQPQVRKKINQVMDAVNQRNR
jgi:hypothetical protein